MSMTITCPPPQTAISADGSPVAVTYPPATTVGGPLPVTFAYTPPSGSLFPVGQTRVLVVATWSNGRTRSCKFPVTVTHVVEEPLPVPPLTVTCPPAQQAETSNAIGVAVSYPAPTTTGGAPPVTITATPPSGSVFPVGTTTVQVTAQDAAGASMNCSFPVTVADAPSEPPPPDPIPPPPDVGAAHDYFNNLVARPDHLTSYSLRSQTQLNGIVNVPPSGYFTYDYAHDPYPDRQDGAKFYKPADDRLGFESDSIPGNQQLKMPLGDGGITDGAILITWDFWYGPEFRTNIDPANLDNYKTFQTRQVNDFLWWTHLNQFRARDEASPTMISKEFTAIQPFGQALPAGLSLFKPYSPGGAGTIATRTFPVYHSIWTRYWKEIRPNVPASSPLWDSWKSTSAAAAGLTGTHHMISIWMADENRAAQRLIYRAPATIKEPGAAIPRFDFEFNTSSHPPAQLGPLVGYGRNMVALRNVADVEAAGLLVKPIG